MSTVILEGCAGAAKVLKCSCEHSSTTNENDIWIAGIICSAVVLVAIIVLIALILWKQKKNQKASTGEDKNNEYDPTIKQKAELQSRLLNFLEKNTSKEEFCDKEEKRVKKQREINSKESQYYIDVLRALIKDEDIPAYSKE